MGNLIFYFPKRSATSATNFLIQLKRNYRNSAIAEPYFRTRSKRYLTSSIKFIKHDAKFRIFAILGNAGASNLPKVGIWRYYD